MKSMSYSFTTTFTMVLTPEIVRLDFFDDILVPPNLMFPGSFL